MSLFHRPFLQEMAAEKKAARRAAWRNFFYTLLRILLLGIAAVATVFLFWKSYPKSSYHLLAWLALAPFSYAVLHCKRAWGAFVYAWLTGTAVYAALYHWVYITCLQGGELSKELSVAAWLGLSALLAVQFAVFGISCFYFKRLKGFFPVLAAVGWVALEWMHGMLAVYVLGFPWFTLAYSQWNFPQVLQIAPFTGAAGVSFWVAFVGLNIGYAFFTPTIRKGLLHFFLAAVSFVAVYEYGGWVLTRPQPRSLLRLRAAVMQPNIDQYKKWSPEFEQEIHDTLQELYTKAVEQPVRLVVWPESVMPGPVQEEPYDEWVLSWIQQKAVWQLLGSNRMDEEQAFVSSFLFSPEGEVAGSYDKIQLVPFGEFIPLEPWVKRLFPQVKVLGQLGGFSAGDNGQPLLAIDQILMGNTICYESIFPRVWRSQAQAGARFFVNITNDAWFFDTAAPYQHLAAVVLRAVEFRRPVLRAANTGISAVVSPYGVIEQQAPLNTQAVLQTEISLPLEPNLTFFARWGEWFAWICAVFYFTMLLSLMAFVYD